MAAAGDDATKKKFSPWVLVAFALGLAVGVIVATSLRQKSRFAKPGAVPQKPMQMQAPMPVAPEPSAVVEKDSAAAADAACAADRDTHARILVLHAPWCGACKMFLPAYRRASMDPRVAALNVRLHAGVLQNGNAQDIETLRKYDSNHVPTVLGFRKGSAEPVKMEHPRSVDGILAFATELTQAAAATKATATAEGAAAEA